MATKSRSSNSLRVIAGTVLAVGLLAGLGLVASTQNLSDADKAALEKVRDSYRNAMNSVADPKSTAMDDFLNKYIDQGDFRATLHTGQVVNNAAEFKGYLKTMKGLLGVGNAKGPKGSYQITAIDTHARIPLKDKVFSAGTAEETVQAVTKDAQGAAKLGNALSYKTLWTAMLQRDAAGRWKITRASVKVIGGIAPGQLDDIKKLAAASLPNLERETDN